MKTTIKQLYRVLFAGIAILLCWSGAVSAASGDAQKAHRLYQDNCGSCHGADHGGYLAPALNAETLKGRSATALRTVIMVGSFDTLMPPFYGRLTDDDIRLLVEHIQKTPKLPNPQWRLRGHEGFPEGLRQG